MATASAPNPRASLLSGLRTGGVRSSSINVPHSAAPGATFNVPRFASASYNNHIVEEEEDQLADMVVHKMYVNAPPRMQMQHPPMTAAVDGSNNRFSQQQSMRGPMMNTVNQRQAQAQQQALQMQMMQLEMMRLQALQAQQFQAELMAQAQLQQQQNRGYHPPATAGPLNTSFGAAQVRRPSQAEQLRSQLGLSHEEQVPMTAALGGKFGSRGPYGGAEDEFPGSRNGSGYQSPMSPGGYTNVISGGTSLSSTSSASVAPSKSDSAVSWRRAPTNHSVLRKSPPPEVKITTPPAVRITPPPVDTDVVTPTFTAPNARGSPGASPVRTRPSPLRFTPAARLPSVAVDEGTDGEDNTSDSSKSTASSSPVTPESASSFAPLLSPREEASKKLYEGLGLGRPAPVPAPMSPSPVTVTASLPLRVLSQPVRQPRGPPSGADELGPRNFATRIRKQAIGGLGALMGARERRDVVEAY